MGKNGFILRSFVIFRIFYDHFGTFCVHFVHFVHFSDFGIMGQEKSGNPAVRSQKTALLRLADCVVSNDIVSMSAFHSLPRFFPIRDVNEQHFFQCCDNPSSDMSSTADKPN
jgi:hypothetical protein